MREIEIDLKDAKTEYNVLNIFGKALGYSEEKYWGKNWDAFNDILGYLDSGGIYGTNEILGSIVLLIKNSNDFKYNAPQEYTILLSILNEAKTKNPDFDFFVECQF